MQWLDVIGCNFAFAADFIDESSDKLGHRCTNLVDLLIFESTFRIKAITFSNTRKKSHKEYPVGKLLQYSQT